MADDEQDPAGGDSALTSPMPAPEPGLTPVHGLAAFGAAVGLGLLLSLLVMAPFASVDGDLETLTDSPVAVLLMAMATQLGFVLTVWLVLHLHRLPWRSTLALWPLPVWQWALAAVGMAAASVAGDAVAGLLRRLWPHLPSLLDDAADLFGSLQGPALWAVAALFAVVPAVAEELLFRGLLYRAFVGRWGAGAAIGLTAALFAGMHLDPLQSPAALVLGVYLGALRWRSGSLYAPVAAHAANNFLAVFVMAAQATGPATRVDPSPATVLGGLIVGLGCLALVRGVRR